MVSIDKHICLRLGDGNIIIYHDILVYAIAHSGPASMVHIQHFS